MWGRKKNFPAFYSSYLSGLGSAPRPATRLEEVRFAVLDLESTGLDAGKDQWLSVSAIAVVGNEIRMEDRYEALIRQDRPVSNPQIAIHGIIPGRQLSGLPEREVLEGLLGFLGQAVIVGHHIAFDLELINRALKRHGCGKLKNPVLDTIGLARRLHRGPEMPGMFTLDALCRQYRIAAEGRHTSAGDAFVTAWLFLKLKARLQAKGVHTLKGLLSKRAWPF